MTTITLLARVDTLAPAFIDAAERGAVVLIVALIVTSMMRRRSAAARHLVWAGAIAVQLVLPLLAAWGPRVDVTVPDAVAKVMPTGDAARPRVPRLTQRTLPVVETQGAELSSPPVAPGQLPAGAPSEGIRTTWTQLAFLVWSVGALIVLARLAAGTAVVARLARAGRRIDDGAWLALAQRIGGGLGIRRPLTLLKGNTVSVPITWGILFPVVLLPDDSDSWPDERRQFVLVHELAHVKRLDALTQFAGQIALALFWFDPLVWVANRRMQLEREHACDDYVLRHGTTASLYAEELLAMVRRLGAGDRRSQPSFAALAMARRSEFEGRMLSILDPVLDRHPLSGRRTTVGALAAMCLIVPLAALHPRQRVLVPVPTMRHTNTPPAIAVPGSYRDSTSVQARLSDTARTRLPLQATSPTVPFAAAIGKMDAAAQTMSTAAAPKTSARVAVPCDEGNFEGPRPANAARPLFVVDGKVISDDRPTRPSLSVHSNDDGRGNASMEVLSVTADRCSSASVIGLMTYNANESDVIAAPPGATALFRERTASDDRQLTISATTDGSIGHAYTHNGQPASFDSDARAWLARFLPTILAEASVNVKPRVARWMAAGGLNGVLTNIAEIRGTSARREHYQVLLNTNVLTTDQTDIVVIEAARDLRSAAYDLNSVLVKLAPNSHRDAHIAAALEPAIAQLQSDYDKTSILQAYGASHDRDMLMMVTRMSRSISSDGDRSRLLISLAPDILGPNDHDLNAEFIRSAASISQSGDRSRLLHAAVQFAPKSEDLARGLIEAARGVSQSGDRARVLMSLLSSGATKTDALRDSFMAAAREIPDEAERSRVLRAASRP